MSDPWLEPLHLIQLVPLALTLSLWRRAKPEHRWLALAWALSYPEDSYAFYHRGSWAAYYVLFPLELWAAFCALLDRWGDRTILLGVLAVLAGVSCALSYPGADILLTVIGGAGLWLMASQDRKLVVPILLYYVGGGAFFVATYSVAWLGGMDTAYMIQVCRIAAYAVFALAVLTERRPAGGLLD